MTSQGRRISAVTTCAAVSLQESTMATCTTAVTIKAIAAIAAIAITPGATTIAAAALHVCAAHGCVSAITCDTDVPSGVTAGAAVEAVATIASEFARISAFTGSNAGACARGIGKTIAAKDSGIRTLRCAIVEKYIYARSGVVFDARNNPRQSALAISAGNSDGLSEIPRRFECVLDTRLIG